MAYDFSGTNQHIDATIAAVDTGDWSAIMWAQFDATSNQQPFSVFGSYDVQYVYIDTGGAAGQIQVAQNFGNFSTMAIRQTSTTVTTATWYVIATVYDDATKTLRVWVGTDSSAIAEASYASSQTGSGVRDTGGVTLRLGEDASGGSDLDGRLEHVMFFARALSSAEMEAYRTGTLPDLTSCRCWLPLVGASPLTDGSGNGANGTATGATHTTDVHTLAAAGKAAVPPMLTAARRALLAR